MLVFTQIDALDYIEVSERRGNEADELLWGFSLLRFFIQFMRRFLKVFLI